MFHLRRSESSTRAPDGRQAQELAEGPPPALHEQRARFRAALPLPAPRRARGFVSWPATGRMAANIGRRVRTYSTTVQLALSRPVSAQAPDCARRVWRWWVVATGECACMHARRHVYLLVSRKAVDYTNSVMHRVLKRKTGRPARPPADGQGRRALLGFSAINLTCDRYMPLLPRNGQPAGSSTNAGQTTRTRERRLHCMTC